MADDGIVIEEGAAAELKRARGPEENRVRVEQLEAVLKRALQGVWGWRDEADQILGEP